MKKLRMVHQSIFVLICPLELTVIIMKGIIHGLTKQNSEMRIRKHGSGVGMHLTKFGRGSAIQASNFAKV